MRSLRNCSEVTDLLAWLEAESGPFAIRLFSGVSIGGKSGEVFFAIEATQSGSNEVELELHPEDSVNTFKTHESHRMSIRIDQFSIWPDGVVGMGPVIEWSAWENPTVRDWYRTYIDGEYRELRSNGRYWYPDFEITRRAQGHGLLIPRDAPGIDTWLPPNHLQYATRPSPRVEQMFTDAAGSLVAGTTQSGATLLESTGEWLARRGRRDLVEPQLDALSAAIPEVEMLTARLRFFEDPEWADTTFRKAAAHFDWGSMLISRWSDEIARTPHRF